ncbi:MAG: nitroreductase family deazaflavin-dependent oxidoreductase [Chloroflexota bacterium]
MIGFNQFVTLVLASPFHGLFGMSQNMLLLTVTGRKSGNLYTFPVEYVEDGDTLIILSHLHRTWWKNLTDDAQVRLCLRGRVLTAHAELKTDPAQVAGYLTRVLEQRPMLARFYRVERTETGFNRDDVYDAAHNVVAVVLAREVQGQPVPVRIRI